MPGRLRIIFALVLLLAFSDAGAAVRGRDRRVQTDTVALECRGVMESFPKVEEGLEERLAFYRDKGLNHYFYCPSDDRYCNRWGWKFLYNDSDRLQLKKFNSLCRENGLEFVWTLDPGTRYAWTPEDYKFLLDKLLMMYYGGLRSFAVRFSGNEGDHAALRDSLHKHFVATRKEKVSLFMLPAIPEVKYPSEGRTAVESLMQGYHFDKAFSTEAKAADAIVCNLEAQDEFAKLAVVAAADFARDPDRYSAHQSMADAVSVMEPDVREAFLTFLRHTGSGAPATPVEVFSLDSWSAEKSAVLYEEFDRIEKVPSKMSRAAHSEVLDALRPWLEEFGRLGTRGKKVLQCMDNYVNGNIGEFWINYLQTVMTPQEEEAYAAYPVGAGILHPFCVESMAGMKEGFAAMLTGKTALHNLATTLYATPNAALDSDFTTSMQSDGHIEFAIPAEANTCHLLTGPVPSDRQVLFRQLRTDGSLVAEFVLKSPFTTFDLKEGAVKVDVMGDITIYENIFVYL